MAETFLARCLLLDLETRGREAVERVGAVFGKRAFERRGSFRLAAAMAELDRLGAPAEFLLGHNLLGHDLPVLRRLVPGAALLRKPVVDTLYLSPLAHPENPYHRLIKDYKLVRHAASDPLADARLAARAFRHQWRRLARAGREEPELLAFYAFCLGAVEPGLEAVLAELAGRPAMAAAEAAAWVAASFAGAACRRALEELPPASLSSAARPAWAYAAAWLRVAGGDSVLPPWVRHRFPETVPLLAALRDRPCGDAVCVWCREAHDPHALLRRFFGFPGFRGEAQEAIARAGLAERPHLAILPTGGGKSLCYQLPALARYRRRGVLTVVLSPLQALMRDQVGALERRTDHAAALYGLLTPIERGKVLEGVRLGDVGLLYAAPEQLRNRSFRRAVRQREIGAWVFDEAHCLSKWGHDFRPDYLYAARFIRELAEEQGVEPPPVACFTATARRDVKAEILDHFARHLGQELEVFEAAVERPELRFRVEAVAAARRLPRVHELLDEHFGGRNGDGGCAVVYCASRRGSEETAEYLRRRGLRAAAFHAGLKAPEKREVLAGFLGDELPVVCATNAFGMGVDKADVRLVVHADLPGSLESYLQEAGRAGRDRRPSDCVLLFEDESAEAQFRLAAMGRLSRRDIARVLRAVRRRLPPGRGEVVATTADLLRDEEAEADFAAAHPLAATRAHTAIAWLERAGFLERGENRTSVFQGRLRVASVEEARRRLAALGLPAAERRRWLALVEALLNAEPDEGLSADELAELPAMAPGAGEAGEEGEDEEAGGGEGGPTPGQRVLRALNRMAEVGLLEAGLRLTAYLRPRGRGNARAAFDALCRLERALLEELRAAEPNAEEGQWLELSLRLLNQRLVDRAGRGEAEVRSHPEILRALLRGLSEDGRGLAGRRGSLDLFHLSRQRYRARLLRSWEELTALAERRRAVAGVLLAELLGRVPAPVPAGVGGKVRVSFGSADLTAALARDLALGGQLRDPLAAVERGLLFLHEHGVVQLQQGLAVFRQAMTLRPRPEARGRRYTRGDYSPLAHHYGERVFQIHVMARYARLGVEAVAAALGLARDYFQLGKEPFVRRHFAGEEKVLARATSQASYHAIVESLGSVAQTRLVAAPAGDNLLILAGPGAGKTRVVVHRAAYLLRVERVPARALLVLCFNRNAALEVSRRLWALVGDDARGVTVRTYHGLAMALTGTSFAASVDGRGEGEPDFGRLIPDAVRLLTDPEAAGTGELGADGEELRERLLAGYSHILVDEYQDVTRPQYELIAAIAGRSQKDGDRKLAILAVGDDDQSIYGFAGASVEFIRRFRDDYGARVHHLVENYRSTAHILAAANQLIAHNRERMKGEHPARVDEARRRDPAGGRWQALDPLDRGRVAVVEVADEAGQALALVAELRRLRDLDPELDWRRVAVLGRTRRALEPARSALEAAGIPVTWTADRRRLPPASRVREVAAFLEVLAACRRKLFRAEALAELLADLRRRLGAPGGAAAAPAPDPLFNPWWELLAEILAEWREASGGGELAGGTVLEFVYEALAERRREPTFGRGARLATAHAAKGLEFDHVFLADGGWRRGGDEGRREEERRLCYVAMTRARQTLRLVARRDLANPHLPLLSGPFLIRRPPCGPPPDLDPIAVRRRFQLLGLADLHLSHAGYHPPAHPVHRHLSRLRPGCRLRLAPAAGRDPRVLLTDAEGIAVAALSRGAARRFRELEAPPAARVLALVQRRAEDADPAYRRDLRCDRWEVPVVEVVWEGRGGAL